MKKSKNTEPTQAEIIKQYLQAGNTITTIEAFKLFQITSLAQRIYDLRVKHGLIIDGEPISHNGKRFMQYRWNELNDTATGGSE